jgi:predicted transcriptional regulator
MTTKALHNLLIPAPKLNQMYLMQQIAQNPNITQAELAHTCSLSVAMVNNYMKDLCAQGFLDYDKKSSRSISYYLTDAGKSALEEIGRELIQDLVTLFTETKVRILQTVQKQAGKQEIRRVVLFGTGDLAELAFHALESARIDIVGVCAAPTPGAVHDWCGREMLNPTQIRFLAPDAVVIAETSRTDEIVQSLAYLQNRGICLISLNGVSNALLVSGNPAVVAAPESYLAEENAESYV